MSQLTAMQSDTTETNLKMFANQFGDFKEMLNFLCNSIKNKLGRDALILLCEDEKVRSMWTLLSKEGIESTIFCSDMVDDDSTVINEKNKFIKSSTPIAICSFQAFKNIDLPIADNYFFVHIPEKRSSLPKILDSLEKLEENRAVRVDFMVSMEEEPVKVQMVHTEFMYRNRVCPEWMAEYIMKNFGSTERGNQRNPFTQYREKDSVVSSSENSGSPTTSFLSRNEDSPVPSIQKSSRSPMDFKPNAEGKYLVPSKYVCNEEDSEDDGMDLSVESFHESDYEFNEHYEQDEYDHEYI